MEPHHAPLPRAHAGIPARAARAHTYTHASTNACTNQQVSTPAAPLACACLPAPTHAHVRAHPLLARASVNAKACKQRAACVATLTHARVHTRAPTRARIRAYSPARTLICASAAAALVCNGCARQSASHDRNDREHTEATSHPTGGLFPHSESVAKGSRGARPERLRRLKNAVLPYPTSVCHATQLTPPRGGPILRGAHSSAATTPSRRRRCQRPRPSRADAGAPPLPGLRALVRRSCAARGRCRL